MKIGIIGGGVVGHATARAFIEHVEEVRIYDILPEKRTHSNIKDVIEGCDLTFICLPTPQQAGSDYLDTKVIREFFELMMMLGIRWTNHNFVLRSTVPIGFTREAIKAYGLLNLVHSPEFLTARCAVTDAQMPSRNIIGFNGYLEGKSLGSNDCASMLYGLYKKRFPHVPIFCMSSDESEAVKLFQNSFFAVKVAFFNEINELATKLGLNWQTVLNGMLSDGRISPSHTKVPGPDGQYGFGGTCLPKDLAALKAQMRLQALDSLITHAALIRNGYDRQRK